MRKTFLLLTLLALGAWQMEAQKFPELDGSPLDVAYFPNGLQMFEIQQKPAQEPFIKLYYSRPQLKEREMLGTKNVPFGKQWRMGANEANEITFYQNVSFGGKNIPAGTYTIFVVPNENEWTFQLYEKLNTWGNYTLGDAKPIASATGKTNRVNEKIEALSMMFKEVEGGAHLMVGWENTVVEVPIKL